MEHTMEYLKWITPKNHLHVHTFIYFELASSPIVKTADHLKWKALVYPVSLSVFFFKRSKGPNFSL